MRQQTWKITLRLTDIPVAEEDYYTKHEVVKAVEEAFSDLCAGLSISDVEVELVA